MTMTEFSNPASQKDSVTSDLEKTNSGRFTELSANKLRGGYYTPKDVARWLCAWAIRDKGDKILEPSCGDGEFLLAAAQRLAELGSNSPSRANHLLGVEILSDEADKARKKLTGDLGYRARDVVETDDFFSWWNRPGRASFDVVIGNPPFIRYQSFPEPHRSRAIEIMKGQGLRPNRLTNIWVPFVVAAAASLKAGGRMALVLPAELLQVSYAAQLRSFLTDRFGRIDLVACNELFFDKAEQEVVLLLADDARENPSEDSPCQVTLTEKNSVSEIINSKPSDVVKNSSPKTIFHDDEKWLKYFLSAGEIEFIRELRASGVAAPLNTYASVNVGVVTGKNQFFVLRQSEVERYGLQDHVMPLISRSAHLQGARIGKRDWKKLSGEDQRVHLLNLAQVDESEVQGALEDYIRSGEEEGVHKGYKCSIRKPWYAVPSIWTPDGFFFRQIYDFPRIVLNTANATSTDTIHRMRCKTEPRKIIANTYTYLTAASAEIEGRSYGGGVLELEPTEAERLLMPAELGSAMPLQEVDKLVRQGRLSEVLEENSRLILMDHMGLSRAECLILKNIWDKMRNRRLLRKRGAKGSAL
jgi:adenine-specific DNA methylase